MSYLHEVCYNYSFHCQNYINQNETTISIRIIIFNWNFFFHLRALAPQLQILQNMDFLTKHNKANLKQLDKVMKSIKQLGLDVNNLPAVSQLPMVIDPKENQTKKQEINDEDKNIFENLQFYLKQKQQKNGTEEIHQSNSISNRGQVRYTPTINQPTLRNNRVEYTGGQINQVAEDEDSLSETLNYYYQQKAKERHVQGYEQPEIENNNEDYSFNFDQFKYLEDTYQPQQQIVWESKIKKNQKIVKQNIRNQPAPKGIIITSKDKNKVTIEKVFMKKQVGPVNYIKADVKQWQNYNSKDDYILDSVLRRFKNIKQFQNNQKAIIKCGRAGHDIFVCMPTGGGKSLTFQFLTFLVKGVYICVMPLISLIFDQECQARNMGIEAYSLTANTKGRQLKQIYNKILNFRQSQNSIVVFCTPEKINLDQNFQEVIRQIYNSGFLKRFVIDQVHCVSAWGKDFRGQYENLNSLRNKYPKTPILALTATVTEVVKQDVIKQLRIEKCYFFQSSFNRPNLYYEIREKTKRVKQDIEAIIRRYPNQTGIIYCLSKKQCRQTSDYLNKMGHKTAFYFADINEKQKKYIQEMWMSNQITIIIATIAFGMGINKPDVRYVVHQTMSKSLQNYYQESGRAGRDGLFSECILFYRKGDKQFLQSMNFQNDFSTMERKQFSSKQLAEMIRYCEDKTTCRRQFQLKYLGQLDFDPKNCNKSCDNCKRGCQYLEYQCIEEAKALVNLIILADRCYVNLSTAQLITLLKGKLEKNAQFKEDKLEKCGANLYQVKELFKFWKKNQIESLLLELISAEIITEKVVKVNIPGKRARNNGIINLYLKSHAYNCKLFLQKVQSLPFKRDTGNKISNRNSVQYETDEAQDIKQDESSVQEDESFQNRVLTEQERLKKYQEYKSFLEDVFEDDFEDKQ